MTMKLTSRQVGGITVVDLTGRLTLGDDTAAFRETIKAIAAKGNKHIVLNLADVTYIDSAGIGELVGAYTSMRNQGGDLKLLNLTKRVHDLLQITKLYTVFEVLEDETQAVAAFSGRAA